MRLFFFIFFIFFAPLCEAKKTIILDIDDTLCWHTMDAQLATAVAEKYPDLIRVSGLESHPGAYYFFVPHISHFLRFLILKDFDIYFFSAGSEARNCELIEEFLPQIFEEEEFEELVEAGQLKYFSGHYRISALCGDDIINESEVENCTKFKHFPFGLIQNRKVKCLRDVLPDVELYDMVLIDDQVLNGISYDITTEKKYYKTNCLGEEYRCFPGTEGATEVVKQFVTEDRAELPMIQPASVPDFLAKLVEDEIEPIVDFIFKSASYYTGVLSAALEFMEGDEMSFREAVRRLLHPDKALEEIDIGELTPFDKEQNPNRDLFLERGEAEIEEIASMLTCVKTAQRDDCVDENNPLNYLASVATR